MSVGTKRWGPIAYRPCAPTPELPPLQPTSSIYMAWCGHVLRRGLDLAQLRADWDDVRGYEMNGAIFSTERRHLRTYTRLHARVSSALGEPLERLPRLFGWDLNTTRLGCGAAVGHLRFCRECLRTRYHSTLFQHLALSRCPLHQLPLLPGCFHCSQLIDVTMKTMTSHPFSCPSCGEMLTPTVFESDPEANAQVDSLLLSRYEGIAASSAFSAGIGTLFPRTMVMGELEYRRLRRLTVAAPAPPASVGALPFPIFRLELFGPQPYDLAMAHLIPPETRAVIGLLKWIWARWPTPCRHALRLIERLGCNPNGCRYRGRISVLTAAICQMLFVYGLARLFFREFIANPQDAFSLEHCTDLPRLPVRFGPTVPYPRVSGACLLMEMIGFLAVAISRCAAAERAIDISWSQGPPVEAFIPVWLVDPQNGQPLRIRTRANEQVLSRIGGRYESAWLEGDEESVHELGTSVCYEAPSQIPLLGLSRLGEGSG